MEMKTYNSSTIHSIGYRPDTGVMHIKFHSGQTYAYEGVSEEQYHELTKAESVGKSFHQIKGSLKGRRI